MHKRHMWEREHSHDNQIFWTSHVYATKAANERVGDSSAHSDVESNNHAQPPPVELSHGCCFGFTQPQSNIFAEIITSSNNSERDFSTQSTLLYYQLGTNRLGIPGILSAWHTMAQPNQEKGVTFYFKISPPGWRQRLLLPRSFGVCVLMCWFCL